MLESKRRKYEEQITYLEGEADYLEIIDAKRYQNMIWTRRAEAKRIRRLIEK